MLDGADSYMYNKITGKVTPIEYKDGQYVFYVWVQKDPTAVQVDKTNILKSSQFAALAVEEENEGPGFPRQGSSL